MMTTKTGLVKRVEEMPMWQKAALGVVGVTAVVATGGLAAYAVAQGGVVVAVGEVLVVAGPAAKILAAKA